MRLKEERVLMVLAVFGVLLIFLTILIQIADSKIHEHEEMIRTKELLNIHYLSVMGNYQVSAVYNLIASFDPNRLQINLSEVEKNFNEAMEGKEKLGLMAIQKANEINELRERGTIWTEIKSVAYTIQFALIILSVLGYFYIFKGIQKRLKKT
jgi:hypothetical protein